MKLKLAKQANGVYTFELENGNQFTIEAVSEDTFSMVNLSADGFQIETIADSEQSLVFDNAILISPEG